MAGIARRILLAEAVALAITPAAKAAGPLEEIRIDWATYNPVSMVLKQKGLLEKVTLVTHDVDEAVVLVDRVLVMRPRSGRLFDQIEINLGRPRDRNSALFENFKRSVVTSLDRSVPDRDATQGPGQALWW